MNIQTLGPYIKTVEDARELAMMLDRVSEGLFKTNDNATQAVLNEVPYELGAAINKLAADQGVGIENKAGVQDFFVKLQEDLQKLPVVKLTLAVKPKAQLINLIHGWFYNTYHKMVLLDITVNPDIMAGSIVSANGKYYDASLAKQVNEIRDQGLGVRG